ncbi:Ribosomal protein L11 methyltransferase [Dissulfuribacter thermophilus]|uniref:Ribosomal protein L11 methyltransferase n=1 Tax=Dissulfuribacter thermophilus TaxID=1156395 RepID=A0A1B9F2Y3_9BACT|nr:50S ribosomal protein L11 methyltransferase [Dissulfuribacter thermophilus]OCC14282.1 Ribosomal protein L11 methyltransferase [Dissulfuribacter thermophilus]
MQGSLILKIFNREKDLIDKIVSILNSHPVGSCLTVKKYDIETLLITGFNNDHEINKLLQLFSKSFPNDLPFSISVVDKDVDIPLNNSLLLENTLRIVPVGESKPPSPMDRTDGCIKNIFIKCQQSFGYGTHPSTRGALLALIWLFRRGNLSEKIVLDCGTGSGILSLAALFLGAKKVVGIDISQEAIKEARENAGLNNCPKERLSFLKGSALETDLQGYDLIIANMVPSVMEIFSKRLVESDLKSGAIVITSGSKSKATHHWLRQCQTGALINHNNKFKPIKSFNIEGWFTTVWEK